ncbi:MAG: DUF4825 domain-containing protein [Solibacillus sp.]
MKQILKFSSFFLLAILFLSGCNAIDEDEDLFKYKDSYVGDNSAVGNILNQLQAAEFLKGFELKTTEEPYGIVLNYEWTESKQNYKNTAIHNATFLFALIQNVEWISFNFSNQEYKITKEQLQNWYGKDLSELQSEDEIKPFMQKHLADEDKVNQLFVP